MREAIQKSLLSYSNLRLGAALKMTTYVTSEWVRANVITLKEIDKHVVKLQEQYDELQREFRDLNNEHAELRWRIHDLEQ